MAEDLLVIGAGGFGRETLDVVEAINASAASPPWNVVGVVDDAPRAIDLARLRARGYAHVGAISENVDLLAVSRHVIAIGSPSVRSRVAAQLGASALAATLVHPGAAIGSEVTLSDGVVICVGALVSTNVTLGRHVHLNPGAIVGHDTELADFVSVNPGAVISGETKIGSGTLIGAGAVILQGQSVGERVTVGASACVTRDVPDDRVTKGVPAR